MLVLCILLALMIAQALIFKIIIIPKKLDEGFAKGYDEGYKESYNNSIKEISKLKEIKFGSNKEEIKKDNIDVPFDSVSLIVHLIKRSGLDITLGKYKKNFYNIQIENKFYIGIRTPFGVIEILRPIERYKEFDIPVIRKGWKPTINSPKDAEELMNKFAKYIKTGNLY